MSLFDSAKETARKAAEKSKEFAADHKDQVAKAVDKGGSLVDRQTKGRYTDRIGKATSKAGEYVERIPDKDDPPASDPQTPTS